MFREKLTEMAPGFSENLNAETLKEKARAQRTIKSILKNF